MATATTHQAASSTGLEHDARLSTTDHGQISPADVAIGVIIGRTSEAFSFFVYGIASVLVFPSLVFPFLDRRMGILASFLVFGLAFLARPIGSVVFMWIDRRHGRGTKLTLALILLGGSTASVAFLPGYNEIGYLSVLGLLLFRSGQGFALAGAWDGLASLLALNAPEGHRGRFAMIPQLGAPFGFMVAAGLFAYFVIELSPEDFLGWGWRYCFFVAFVINVVALFARLRLIATSEFAQLYEARALTPVPVFGMLRADGRNVLIGAFIPLATYALYQLVTIYPIFYIVATGRRPLGQFLLILCAGAVIQVITTVLSGFVADQIGRRNLIGICAGGIAMLSLLTPPLLGGDLTGETMFVLVGFGLLGFSFGQAAGAVATNFSHGNRYTGSALTSDLAWLIGAGFAPLAAIGGYEQFGLWAVCAYLMSGAVCTLVALVSPRAYAILRAEFGGRSLRSMQ